MKSLLYLLLLLVPFRAVYGQCQSGGYALSQQASVPYAMNKQSMEAMHDANGKPYMYVAGKERGLVIYDISNLSSPVQVDSVPTSQLNNMEVMNLVQNGNYLYLALGNHFVSGSKPGMAIIDITTPANATVSDTWDWPVASGGAGIVKVDGNYAFLGAMRQGLIILDIANKNNIGFVSHIIPAKNWPNPSFPDSLKYNARGMEIAGSNLYLCYDAGGIRVIDISNKSVPIEVGKYSNSAIYNQHRAYNNIVIDDTLAYVALDYCGMEVLNISTPSNIKQKAWWNPWQCDTGSNPNLNWSNNNGHSNDIRYKKECKLLFISSGKSELQVVSVANPSTPQLCDSFGTIANNEATWGVSLYHNQLYLTYIYAVYVPIITPFGSNWGGVKILKWDDQCSRTAVETGALPDFKIYPNPSAGVITLQFNRYIEDFSLDIYNIIGERCFRKTGEGATNKIVLGLESLPEGSYTVNLRIGESVINKHIFIAR